MLLFCTLSLAFVLASEAADPPYGQLSIKNCQLVGSDGKPIQLAGMSLFWSVWMSKYWNQETIHQLKCAWNSNVVRLPMAVDNGGYLTDPNGQLKLVEDTLDACIKEGIYCIVDWHEEQAVQHTAQAKEFFQKIAAKYGKYPNILYELYNEPNGPAWPAIKSYCEEVSKAIRAEDPDNIIICGTPQWDQKVMDAANDPITDVPNIMYTLHYYAGSHKEDLRQQAQQAINKCLPIFITEYGTTNADAQSNLDAAESQKWWDFNDKNKLSYANWAVSDKSEAASALTPGTTPQQVGDPSHWTESGKLVNAHMKKLNTGVSCDGKNNSNSAISSVAPSASTTKASSTKSGASSDSTKSSPKSSTASTSTATTTTSSTKNNNNNNQNKQNVPNDKGQYPDANGNYPDEKGNYPDAKGNYPINGYYPDAKGNYPDANGNYP